MKCAVALLLLLTGVSPVAASWSLHDRGCNWRGVGDDRLIRVFVDANMPGFIACLSSGPGDGCEVPPCQPCDANCDGTVNAADLDAFEDLLSGQAEPCSWCAGDANCDGTVDAADYDPLSECVTSGPGAECLWGDAEPGVEPPPSGTFTLHGRPVDVLGDGKVLLDVRARCRRGEPV